MRRVHPKNIGYEQDNYYIHLARYMFVMRQIRPEFSILEIGCGTGYGARLLADKAKQVIATDKADQELRESWNVYDKANLTFTDKIPDNKFDIVVSFEVVEHIPEKEIPDYFETIKSHMKSAGVAFLSTPRALPFEERSKNRQLEHVKEYEYKEFCSLLDSNFKNVFVFSQNDAIISSQSPSMAWNFVAICTI